MKHSQYKIIIYVIGLLCPPPLGPPPPIITSTIWSSVCPLKSDSNFVMADRMSRGPKNYLSDRRPHVPGSGMCFYPLWRKDDEGVSYNHEGEKRWSGKSVKGDDH